MLNRTGGSLSALRGVVNLTRASASSALTEMVEHLLPANDLYRLRAPERGIASLHVTEESVSLAAQHGMVSVTGIA